MAGPEKPQLKQEVEKAVAQLRTMRDEIRLHLHLANLEAKEAWQKLEPSLGEIEQKMGQVTAETKTKAQDLLKRFGQLRDQLKQSIPSSSSRSFWKRSMNAAPSSPGRLQTTWAVTSRGTFRCETLIDRSIGVPNGITSAMRMESPPEPTVLVASDAISSGASMSTSSSAGARR